MNAIRFECRAGPQRNVVRVDARAQNPGNSANVRHKQAQLVLTSADATEATSF